MSKIYYSLTFFLLIIFMCKIISYISFVYLALSKMALGWSRDLSRDITISSSSCFCDVELSISSVTILSNCRTF